MAPAPHHNLFLVALSVAIGILASFAALSVSDRIAGAAPAARRWWLLAAAATLGGGTWSMHFVGILAAVGPLSPAFDGGLTAASLLIATAGSAHGLAIVSRFGTSPRPLAAGGLCVGAGIAAMHYAGMAAMHTDGAPVHYDPLLVAASLAIALLASTMALRLAFRPAGLAQQLAAATVMGLAISGMHYTGMAAAPGHFAAHAPSPHAILDAGMLGVVVAGLVGLLLSLALIVSHYDRRLSIAAAHEAEALRGSERRFRTLVENASDIVGIVDQNGILVYESSSTLHVLGYRTDEVLGRHYSEFLVPERLEDTPAVLAQVLDGSLAAASLEVSLLHRDGSIREFELLARNLLHEPTIAGIVMNLRDVTERKRLFGRLQALSETDPLTGAANRRGFFRLAVEALNRSRVTGHELRLVLFDIDHFKQVNDNYGHAAGDLVLATVAKRCLQQLRPSDLLCRWGGEEFLLLLPYDDAAAADQVVARLHRTVAEARVSTIKGEIGVTASFGITALRRSEPDFDAAIKRADDALYAAKQSGRNCVRESA
jgi:diguanylate cyclase (GGDEF)-like protein/PAS domain S-box-containing protein